jgi:hypothetical protein
VIYIYIELYAFILIASLLQYLPTPASSGNIGIKGEVWGWLIEITSKTNVIERGRKIVNWLIVCLSKHEVFERSWKVKNVR